MVNVKRSLKNKGQTPDVCMNKGLECQLLAVLKPKQVRLKLFHLLYNVEKLTFRDEVALFGETKPHYTFSSERI